MKSLRRFFLDPNGNVAVMQAPNLPIAAWAACSLLAMLFTQGSLNHELKFLASAFLFVWSYLEITAGDSYFRRVLGVVVMAAIIASHL